MGDILNRSAHRIKSLHYHGLGAHFIQPYVGTVVDLVAAQPEIVPEGTPWRALLRLPSLSLPPGPPLQNLTLQSMILGSCTWDRLRNLRSLRLELVTIGDCSLSVLVDAILASNGLEILVISHLRGLDTLVPVAVSSAAVMIHLPKLRLITLLNSPNLFVTNLMARLVAPACRSVQVDEAIPEPLVYRWLANSVGPQLRTATKLLIRMGSPMMYFGGGPRDVSYDLSDQSGGIWHWGLSAEAAEWARHILNIGHILSRFACHPEIVLELHNAGVNAIQFDLPLETLDKLGNVVELKYEDAIDISHFLRDKLGSLEPWECPRLRSILVPNFPVDLGFHPGFDARWEVMPQSGGDARLERRDVSLPDSIT